MTDEHKVVLGRGDFLKITAVAAGVTGLGLLAGRKFFGKAIAVSDTRYLLGTLVNLVVVGPDRAEATAAMNAAYGRIEQYMMVFDYRNVDSALGRLNASGRLENAPVELVAVLEQAEEIRMLSDGAFDVRMLPEVLAASRGETPVKPRHGEISISGTTIAFGAPGFAVTLDGIAKGWIVDRAVDELKGRGYGNTMVEAGGDLMSSGLTADLNDWQVGIRHPRREALIGAVPVSNVALATSGDYQHAFSADYARHHIIDPATGISPQTFASVSVLAASCAQADALATTLMVLDLERGRALVETLAGVEALWVTKDEQIIPSAGFPALSATL